MCSSSSNLRDQLAVGGEEGQRVSHSPATSASRMKISRAAGRVDACRSSRAGCCRRRCRTSVARSSATTSAGLLFPVRLEQLLLDHVARRCPAAIAARWRRCRGRTGASSRPVRPRRSSAPASSTGSRPDGGRSGCPARRGTSRRPRSCSRCCPAARRAATGAAARRWPACVQAPAVFGDHGVQLRMQVAPLAHAARRDEVLAQQLLLLAQRQLRLCCSGAGRRAPCTTLVSEPFHSLRSPRNSERSSSNFLCASSAACCCSSGRSRTSCTLKRAGDDQHLGQRLAVARLEDHAAHARVQRQLGQLAADRRELVGLVHRAEFGEQLVAVGDRAARRRLEEGEVLDRAQPQRLHAQDHAGQRRAQDLRVGEARPAGEVLLVVQADADAVADAPAAAGALVGGRLADRLDQQLLDLVAVAVALDARRARSR